MIVCPSLCWLSNSRGGAPRLPVQPLDLHRSDQGLAHRVVDKNTTVELALANPGNVSLTGYSGLRLGNSGGQPSADNHVQFAASSTPANPNRN